MTSSREKLRYFMQEIIPIAEALGVLTAIQSDDPLFSLLELPRVVSNEKDIEQFLITGESPTNGKHCACIRLVRDLK